jgi:glycosyltransferase involved in cell wall biosynthesis
LFISICIPAYKRADFLQRLLDSIAMQNFRDFEVVVTDDSPGQEVEKLCNGYKDRFELHYHRNSQTLGTPENWNESIRRAKGEWIKLMHDDDWFSDADALQHFNKAIKSNPDSTFLFSGYTNIYLEKNNSKEISINGYRYKQLVKDPVTLFSSNVIGPPSVIIHRNDANIVYDKNLRWLVDIDYYIRFLEKTKPIYIPQSLINVGIGKEQVTQDCFRQRQVEIPEGFYLLEKTGTHHLRHILVYDAWWRLLRNLEIRKEADITGSGYAGSIPRVIRSMLGWQKKVPLSWLRFGPFSKSLMFLSYLFAKK